jgi:putative PIN family toxin of toxin-antitoxin system
VFDTNVVASASFWRGTPFDCLTAWATGRCEAAVSPELIAEYHETVEELLKEYPSRKYVDWASALTDAAFLVFPTERAKGATSDPFDEMILECAVGADANVIVTGDKNHLLPIRRYQEIEIVTPSEFLRLLASQ